MQTGENSIREAHTLYHSNLYSLHSALICSKIQVYDVMVGYNSSFLYSIWTPPFLAPFKSFTNCKTSHVLSMGSRIAVRTPCVNSVNKLRGAAIHQKRNCKSRISRTKRFLRIDRGDELDERKYTQDRNSAGTDEKVTN